MPDHYGCDVIQRSMKEAEMRERNQTRHRSSINNWNSESETPPLIIIMSCVALGLFALLVFLYLRH